jgi:hypothetical protein
MKSVTEDACLDNPLSNRPWCETSILARLFEDTRAEEPINVLEETDASSATFQIDAETEVE